MLYLVGRAVISSLRKVLRINPYIDQCKLENKNDI